LAGFDPSTIGRFWGDHRGSREPWDTGGMKKAKTKTRPKAKTKTKRTPREDMNQIAFRVMQETIRRSE